MRKLIVALVLSSACLLAAPAKAVVVVTDYGPSATPPTILVGPYLETFASQPTGLANFSDTFATFAAGHTMLGNNADRPQIVNGTSPNNNVAPLIGTGPATYLTTNYLSVFGGGRETITLNSGYTSNGAFGLYIGSLDPYNSITFRNGNNVIASFNGLEIAALADVTWVLDGHTTHLMAANDCTSCADSNGYVTFTGLGTFTSVVLESSQNSFEVADATFSATVSSGVPEASTWVMMILGFLGLVLTGARRRTALSFRAV